MMGCTVQLIGAARSKGVYGVESGADTRVEGLRSGDGLMSENTSFRWVWGRLGYTSRCHYWFWIHSLCIKQEAGKSRSSDPDVLNLGPSARIGGIAP